MHVNSSAHLVNSSIINIKSSTESFAQGNVIPKTLRIRHPREGGDPVRSLIKVVSRLRGNDENFGFCINLSLFSLVESSSITLISSHKVIIHFGIPA